MDMSIGIPSQLPPPFVPVEVCEHIIDMLYSDIDVSEGLQYTATLHSCALVCRAWRIRAQRTLFYSVHLINVASLNKFAAVLQTARHLEAYVYEVTLSGRSLQTTASMLSPFLIIFQAAKLPNLQRLAVLCVLESAQWYPPTSHSASISPKAKPLPHIPFHSHFSTLLSAFTTLSRLELQETRFRSFGEFARMIAALPNLRSLACTSVRWNTLGGAFPAQTTDGTGAWSRPPFPLKLRSLVLWKSGSHAAKWLLSACGRSPSLKSLSIGIPLGGREESETGVEIDLSLFSELDELTIMPTSTRFAAEKQYSDLLKAMLTSWKPRCSDPYLRFGAETWTYLFTRDEFACILQVVGAVTENWRTEIADTSGKGEVKHLFFIDLYEQERHLREQWVGCFLDAFPTWLKLGGLIVRIENPHGPAYEWAEDSDRIEKISEPADSTSNTALQREASSSQLACKVPSPHAFRDLERH
uniref:Dual O-methyltransferase/FAD-dependent monooxygenase CTB3 (Cercosporin toxin biosynthesis cluster protein 3) n=1 Tax=Ganoderma boninense TaxID=34458 RepID=A0A5K1JUN5_9APHY|nr:Dual O-methyltransferase/FAD-dependent monooxygenase CTB3 (Cercosporin toxin biosynthesis cluster protein 3) [Includes: O-methyltransferase (EC, FAD-dependent monooxygenase (EC ] [Ganoderma boninense]